MLGGQTVGPARNWAGITCNPALPEPLPWCAVPERCQKLADLTGILPEVISSEQRLNQLFQPVFLDTAGLAAGQLALPIDYQRIRQHPGAIAGLTHQFQGMDRP